MRSALPKGAPQGFEEDPPPAPWGKARVLPGSLGSGQMFALLKNTGRTSSAIVYRRYESARAS